MFSIEMEGFDELETRLKQMAQDAKELAGEHEVPLTELLAPRFMRSHTDFESLDDMFEASGFEVETDEDFAAIPDDAWDAFVAKHTTFGSWEGMQQAAAGEWAKRRLGL